MTEQHIADSPLSDQELDELEQAWRDGQTMIFAERRLMAKVRELQKANDYLRDVMRRFDIANAQRVTAWARDPHRRDPILSFTSGAERQAAHWIEWAWKNPPCGNAQVNADDR